MNVTVKKNLVRALGVFWLVITGLLVWWAISVALSPNPDGELVSVYIFLFALAFVKPGVKCLTLQHPLDRMTTATTTVTTDARATVTEN